MAAILVKPRKRKDQMRFLVEMMATRLIGHRPGRQRTQGGQTTTQTLLVLHLQPAIDHRHAEETSSPPTDGD